ncbi:hypothetical protein [Reyranella soli]|uniref:HNH nuclease domain-containing protein n=1 Tax=Reyranella soli TaxID=1230389 RepID=A0A512NI62_9HYPH|nr:hypothetical protein [Reyranella soli]GEP58605.1 hypothetical protein RSO01_57710 [Reyranella soli]
MIRLTPTEPTTPEWKKWRDEAKAGHKLLRTQLQKKGTFDVNESLYKRMKKTLLEMYHGKCVYCETPLVLSSWCQLDHFRPKNEVLDEHKRPVSVDRKGKPHTGYYWLVYEWTNLLPSCAVCNGHKGAIFPVHPGSVHARHPGKEEGEKPIFLHPTKDDPADHFEYIASTGYLKSKSLRGKSCIDLLDLNRGPLCDARKTAYQAYVGLVSDLLHAVKEAEALPARKLADLKATLQGVAKYSLVGRSALKQCEGALQEVFRTTNVGSRKPRRGASSKSSRRARTPPLSRRRSRSAA